MKKIKTLLLACIAFAGIARGQCPTITTGTMPTVSTGATSASIPYSGATGSPSAYNIMWNNAAAAAGFTNAPVSPVTISTYAGNHTAGYSGDRGQATAAKLNFCLRLATDAAGNVYIADGNNSAIRKVTPAGVISTVAGTGTAGYSGDGSAATAAKLNVPYSVAADASGNIYIADRSNNVIREVNTSGIISTIAGTGTAGYSGDGSAATAAKLNLPAGVILDAGGNLYISDATNNVIRKVTPAGIISTFAGNGTSGYSGDGSAATAAKIANPSSMAVDAGGNVYIADKNNNVIRKVSTSGIISTYAGNGTLGYSGDGGAATAAKLNSPSGVAIDPSGNIYITDNGNNIIRKVSVLGVISSIAGSTTAGYSGDGSAATAAKLNQPSGIAVDGNGNLFIADVSNNVIREIKNSASLPSSPIPAAVPATAPAGVYNGTLTVFNGSCGTAYAISVTINPGITGATSVCTGQTTTLSNASGGGTWSSTNTAVATIGSSSGTVMGISNGTAIISYALTGGGSVTTTITVASPAAIAGASGVCSGSTASLTDATPGGAWSSSNTAVATIGSTGTVTGVSGGTATISYGTTGCAATLPFTVTAVAAIGGAASLCSGTTTMLTDATAGGSWSSGRTSVATVGSTGIVTGVSGGTAAISYTIAGCGVATATVTVISSPSTSGSVKACAGATGTITVFTGGGAWSSGNTAVATVGSTGTVTGVSAGTAAITYIVGSGCPAIVSFTVVALPAAIGGSATVCAGATTPLTDATPGGAWGYSNSAVATINSGGTATGVSGGTTTFNYTVAGCSATLSFSVIPTAAIGGASAVCTGNSAAVTNAVTGGVWSSSNTDVATTGSTGTVNGLSPGTATISYTALGCTVTEAFTVGAPPGDITGTFAACALTMTPLSDATTGGAWSSGNSAVAFAGSTGVVTGLSDGTATISYTASGCTVTALFTVSGPTDIGGATTICTGAATLLSDAAAGGTWSSGNTGVATIGSTGIATGVAQGTATISYTASGCTVTTQFMVYASPTITLGAMPVVCVSTASATISYSGTTGSPTYSIAWSDAAIGAGFASTPAYVTLYAGNHTTGYSGDGGPATAAAFNSVSMTATDHNGNLYIADRNNNRVRKVSPNGIITTIAGNGTSGYSGDGGMATDAMITVGLYMAADNDGNVYISGHAAVGHGLVRKISAGGIITTFRSETNVGAMAADYSNNLYAAIGYQVFRLTDTSTSLVVGNGTRSSGDESGPATALGLNGPQQIAFDPSNNMYIADGLANVIRKVTPGGYMSSAAGNGTAGATGDGGPATAATISFPTGVAADNAGNVYIADNGNSVIRMISTAGIINTVAGQGTSSGDNLPATASTFVVPYMVNAAPNGDVYIFDLNRDCVYRLHPDIPLPASPISIAVPGTAPGGEYDGTLSVYNGLCTDTYPVSITLGASVAPISGSSSVCAGGAMVSLTDTASGGAWSSSNTGVATVGSTGTVTGGSTGTAVITYAISGICGAGYATTTISVVSAPDAGSISGTSTLCPGAAGALSESSSGGIWSSSNGNVSLGSATGTSQDITGVLPGTATISYTVTASCGTSFATASITILAAPALSFGSMPVICQGSEFAAWPYSGSGGSYYSMAWSSAAVAAGFPTGLAIISVAGTGSSTGGYSGDGSDALAAALNAPNAVAADGNGNLYITDAGNNVVRKVDAAGTITTVAGNHTLGFSGDGGPATVAQLHAPAGIVADGSGNLYIVDAGNAVVRKVDASGIITTIAGNHALGAGFSGDGGAATAAKLSGPNAIARDNAGNIYITDNSSVVRKVNTSGGISTIAGNHALGNGFSGNDGPATAAQIDVYAGGVAVDAYGYIYIAEWANSVVRVVSPSGIISAFAGNNALGTGYSGDGGIATAAKINCIAVACDNAGNVYIADDNNTVVRQVRGGVIYTIAGSSWGFSGDGGNAASAQMKQPYGVAVDATGIYIADLGNNDVRKVLTSSALTSSPLVLPVPVAATVATYSGTVTVAGASCSSNYTLSVTIAAPVTGSISGPGVVAVGSGITLTESATGGIWSSPGTGVATVGTAGNVTGVAPGTAVISYTTDNGGCIASALKTVTVNPGCTAATTPALSGSATAICGSGSVTLGISSGALDSATGWQWYTGSCGGTAAGSGTSLVVTPTVTTTYYARGEGGCPSPGACGSITITVNTIPVIASLGSNSPVCIGTALNLTASVTGGGGVYSYSWTGPNAFTSTAANPSVSSVTTAASGTYSLSVADEYGCSAAAATTTVALGQQAGNIYTYAGNGVSGFTGDNGPATSAEVKDPRDIATDAAGNLYICEKDDNRIRKISTAGIITTVAGNGTAGNTGDGGQATAARLNGPNGIFVDNSGVIYLCNTISQSIRKINAAGVISTIAGTGTAGYSGDGGQASVAKFNNPVAIAVDAAGNIYIADQQNYRVRLIAATGIITTIAGNGSTGYSGNGGAATAAKLNQVTGLKLDNSGNLYIADCINNVVRKVVLSTGIISNAAGNNVAGYSGDGGQATAAKLNAPARVGFDGAGNLYISEQNSNVIRKVSLASGIINTVGGTGTAGYSGDGGQATAAKFNTPVGVATDTKGNLFVSDALNNRVRVITNTENNSTVITGPTAATTGSSVTYTATAAITSNATYQWSKNGTNVSGATSSTYTNVSPVTGDVYECTVSIAQSCGSPATDNSNSITLTVTGGGREAAPEPAGQFGMYPNPVHETLTITADNLEDGNATIIVRDQLGRDVIKQTATVTGNRLLEKVSMSQLSAGIYLVSVTDVAGTNRIVKCVKD